MDKYSVQTDEETVKTASIKKTCPRCGAEVNFEGNVPRCPNCGTRPWEKKKEGE